MKVKFLLPHSEFRTPRIFLLLLTLFWVPSLSLAAKSDTAVLVMAHGGSPLWDKTVTEAVKQAQIPYPTLVYYGMGHNKAEVDRLQKDIRYLERKGAQRIIVIPMLVSSYSEIFRQWRYLLGQAPSPGFNTNFFPIERRANIQFAEPFNDDSIVALILLDRAREISQTPEQESVIIVAHGPNDNSDNEKWLTTMRRLNATIKERGKFKTVEGMTLRDDAPEEVRSHAINLLRSRVKAIDEAGGKALVIPLLVAPGGIENKIGIALKGLVYTLNGKTLMPDHRISQWLRSKVP